MLKKQIFNIFLILVLLIIPLTGSSFAGDVQPSEVKESIEKNETLEKKDGSVTDEQKAKMKAEKEEQEAIKKAKIEREKAEREEQEALKKKRMEWEKASREQQESMKRKRIEEQEAKKKEPSKSVPNEFWTIKEMGGVK